MSYTKDLPKISQQFNVSLNKCDQSCEKVHPDGFLTIFHDIKKLNCTDYITEIQTSKISLNQK